MILKKSNAVLGLLSSIAVVVHMAYNCFCFLTFYYNPALKLVTSVPLMVLMCGHAICGMCAVFLLGDGTRLDLYPQKNKKTIKTKQFFITQVDISGAQVNLQNRLVTKNAAKYPISAPVVDVNGVTVKKGEYEVTYKVDGKEVNKNTKGTFSKEPIKVTVEIKAKANGNYTGSATGTYTVTLADSSKDLSKAKAIIQKKGDASHKAVKNLKFTGGDIRIGEGEYEDYELYVYTGKSAKNPTAVLKEGTNYVATYSNNVKAGKATVVLNAVEGGESSYFGSKTFTFKIVKGSMPWFK